MKFGLQPATAAAMSPAANPHPPRLAAVAALICALGGLGQAAEHWGATVMGGGRGGPLRLPSTPAAPSPAEGCLQPGTPPRAVFLWVHAAFLLECSFGSGLCLSCVWFLSALKCFTAGGDLGGHNQPVHLQPGLTAGCCCRSNFFLCCLHQKVRLALGGWWW